MHRVAARDRQGAIFIRPFVKGRWVIMRHVPRFEGARIDGYLISVASVFADTNPYRPTPRGFLRFEEHIRGYKAPIDPHVHSGPVAVFEEFMQRVVISHAQTSAMDRRVSP